VTELIQKGRQRKRERERDEKTLEEKNGVENSW